MSLDSIVEAVDMVGRSGGRSFELGYHPAYDADGNELDEATTPASEFRWWAKATFRGAVLAVDDQPDPDAAVRALALRVAAGARCGHCERPIAWGGKRRRHCWWTRHEGRWEPGCVEPDAERR